MTGPMMSMRADPKFLRKGHGQLEGTLTAGSIGTLLLGDPDTEVLVWAEDFNALVLPSAATWKAWPTRKMVKANPWL